MRLLNVFATLLCLGAVASAQMIKRTDAIWGRTTTQPITIDGVLNEPAWAVAESVQIEYGPTGPIPGSGSALEAGSPPSDPLRATIKFLIGGDSLYVAIIAKDSSVGGGLFNRFDGILSNIREKNYMGSHPNSTPWNSEYTGSFEYFYGWVTEPWGCGTVAGQPGALPCYMGFAGGARSDTQSGSWYSGVIKRAIWDAATTVQGAVNNDATRDQGYTIELKHNLALRGYNVRNPNGEIVMYSVSIYDADWQWPLDTVKFSGTRTWLQGPWGNAAHLGHMRILVNPSITTATPSSQLPDFGPDVRIPNGQNFPTPTIDGALAEAVWQNTRSFKIKYGDPFIRNSYPNTGKYRSGQYQHPIDGNKASILDPSTATVRYFFKADTLYFGFDVSDQIVNYRSEANRRDGFLVTINDRARKRQGPNNVNFGQFTWSIRFFVDSADHGGARGRAGYGDDTKALIDSGAIRVGLKLKPGTIVDTLHTNPQRADSGYTAELAITLTKIGYPAGRGDGVVFPGIIYYDGDAFNFGTPNASYATQTHWFREVQDQDGPAWAYMDPSDLVTGVEEIAGFPPETFQLLGNYPNPFNPSTTVRYFMPQAGKVTLQVFDLLGRRVATVDGGSQLPGQHNLLFSATRLSSGTYFYYLEIVPTGASKVVRTATGKMLVIK